MSVKQNLHILGCTNSVIRASKGEDIGEVVITGFDLKLSSLSVGYDFSGKNARHWMLCLLSIDLKQN